jgi:hypothetical protein
MLPLSLEIIGAAGIRAIGSGAPCHLFDPSPSRARHRSERKSPGPPGPRPPGPGPLRYVIPSLPSIAPPPDDPKMTPPGVTVRPPPPTPTERGRHATARGRGAGRCPVWLSRGSGERARAGSGPVPRKVLERDGERGAGVLSDLGRHEKAGSVPSLKCPLPPSHYHTGGISRTGVVIPPSPSIRLTFWKWRGLSAKSRRNRRLQHRRGRRWGDFLGPGVCDPQSPQIVGNGLFVGVESLLP